MTAGAVLFEESLQSGEGTYQKGTGTIQAKEKFWLANKEGKLTMNQLKLASGGKSLTIRARNCHVREHSYKKMPTFMMALDERN